MNTSRSTPITTPDTRVRERHYPDVSDSDWSDWRWQFRHRVRTTDRLRDILDLSPDELQGLEFNDGVPFAVTPYYATVVAGSPALRLTVIPSLAEQQRSPGEMVDPLGEEPRSPVHGVVHRYTDRVLLLINNHCPVYCRYCTRGRQVGNGSWKQLSRAQLRQAIAYIAAHPEVHDVLISGGDPLLMSDSMLDWILGELAAIPHLDMVRIGSKIPMVMPQRITPALCRIFRRHHPVFLSLHATHADELTLAAEQACRALADAGVPIGSQTVLLKNINDTVSDLTDLFRGLLRSRVRPYYLLQCDPVNGSAHFRVPVDTGVELIRQLQGQVSGYAIPRYIIDIPGGAGKIPISPDYIEGRDAKGLRLRNHEGRSGFHYPDF